MNESQFVCPHPAPAFLISCVRLIRRCATVPSILMVVDARYVSGFVLCTVRYDEG
jgi:hypothetical protein